MVSINTDNMLATFWYSGYANNSSLDIGIGTICPSGLIEGNIKPCLLYQQPHIMDHNIPHKPVFLGRTHLASLQYAMSKASCLFWCLKIVPSSLFHWWWDCTNSPSSDLSSMVSSLSNYALLFHQNWQLFWSHGMEIMTVITTLAFLLKRMCISISLHICVESFPWIIRNTGLGRINHRK